MSSSAKTLRLCMCPARANVTADALSRIHEGSTFAAMTRAHIIRDKIEPESSGKKKEMVDKAHKFGHFGEQAIFQKNLE